MKHFAALLLILILLFSLSGCLEEAGAPMGSDTVLSTGEPSSSVSDTSVPDSTASPDGSSDHTQSGQTDPPASSATEPSATESVTTAPSQNDPIGADSSFAVHFIDVGQADASLIVCDGHAMLIDGGNAGDSDVIYTYLKKQGIAELDVVVCTHAHEDHVGGLSGALNAATVKKAYCPVTEYSSRAFENFVSYLKKQGVSITVPTVGERFSLGSAECQIIGPVRTGSDTDTNNTSIVLRVRYGDTVFLFTGDAETDEEHDILEAGYDVSCDVLKVGHHGSDTSTSYPFLRAAMPEYAVISVGTDNAYGHPTEATISKLRDADVRVYRTDMQGDIICHSDGKTVTVLPARNADVNTLLPAGEGGGHETQAPVQTNLVWVTATGKRYHAKSDCSGMKNPTEISMDEARARGYTACSKCY